MGVSFIVVVSLSAVSIAVSYVAAHRSKNQGSKGQQPASAERVNMPIPGLCQDAVPDGPDDATVIRPSDIIRPTGRAGIVRR